MMRRKTLLYILAAEAVLCLIAALAGTGLSGAFSSIAAFPFEQLGLGLRALSLSGAAGNLLALVIYWLLSLLPLVYLFVRWRKKRLCGEDFLLALLVPLLLLTLYMMVNPGKLAEIFAVATEAAGLAVCKAALGLCVYSVVIAYVILRLLRRLGGGETGSLLLYLNALLSALCAVLVFAVFYSGISSALGEMASLVKGDASLAPVGSGDLQLSKAFIVLQTLVACLPYLLEIGILFSAMELVSALEIEPYSEEVVAAAGKMSARCRSAVVAILVSQLALNILQLAAGSALMRVSVNLAIPISSIILVLAAMLLARYFGEGKQLKDDNDLFV